LHTTKNFNILKKHFKAYATGFSGAKQLRADLMQTHNAQEVTGAVQQFFKNQDSQLPNIDPKPIQLSPVFDE